MDRREARAILESMKLIDFRFAPKNKANEALDLATEALKGDLHCPKCGTIVRDGRQYHDLVYRGEAEPKEMTLEEWQELDREIRGDAGKLKNPDDSLLTEDSKACKEQKSKLDCISRQQAIEAVERRDLLLAYQGKKIEDNIDDFVGSVVEQVHSRIKRNIESLPPVTPTERTGEWIACTKEGLPLTELMRREGKKWYGYKCTNCSFIYKGNALTESRYCQGCGAKMKGGTENE